MIQPPNVAPMVGAIVAMMPIVAAAMVRCLPGKRTKAAVNTVGIMAPPRKPCAARKAIMLSMSQADPHRTLVNVKPAAEMAKSQRVDSNRLKKPDSGIMTISATR